MLKGQYEYLEGGGWICANIFLVFFQFLLLNKKVHLFKCKVDNLDEQEQRQKQRTSNKREQFKVSR
jgi:hypothetical protein